MSGVELRTERLLVRTPERGEGALFARYYSENREFLQPWSPTFRDEMFSVRDWEASVPVMHQQFSQGSALRFGVYLDSNLIGVCNVTDIKRSPMYSGNLGYTLSEAHQGQGLMGEAVSAVVKYAFEQRGFHRVSAGYVPRNERSGKLLRRLGFVVEGYARDYLLINGKWEDHVLVAKHNEAWREPV